MIRKLLLLWLTILFLIPTAYASDEENYLKVMKMFTKGDYQRKDFRKELKLLNRYISLNPEYMPYYSLKAKIYECMGDRKKSIKIWENCLKLPPPDNQWKTIISQHLAALKVKKEFEVKVQKEGYLDLVEVYNVYGITRDHIRYVSDMSDIKEGYTWEEKHLPDILACPRNVRIKFQLPCLPHLKNREDIDFFRMVIKTYGQELKIINPGNYSSIHFLAFSVSGKNEKGNLILEYEDKTEFRTIEFSDWINRDRTHEPVYRDTEIHMCNGEEFDTQRKPLWMFHYSLKLNKRKKLNKITLPQNDKIRIVAITLKR